MTFAVFKKHFYFENFQIQREGKSVINTSIRTHLYLRTVYLAA